MVVVVIIEIMMTFLIFGLMCTLEETWVDDMRLLVMLLLHS